MAEQTGDEFSFFEPSNIHSVTSSSTNSESRKNSDRRKNPTPMLSRYTFTGRRKNNRRNTDPQKNYYVDRPQKNLALTVFSTFFLGITDAFLTYRLLCNGAAEANPIMNFWLGMGWPYCIFIKLILCGISLTMLLLHQNFYRMPYILASLCLFYCSLVSYEVYLLKIML
ncbi:MAG: hypothetical protein HZA78_13350 [Candidatus Schekmanbacteria bacterium]|nr:hypothetical protein [Candidatus Schekmanbacteria bacterium]